MTITWVAVVVAVVVAIVAVGYFATRQQRRRRLQERFGPEYERAVKERESRREAEQDLREREQRHAQLDIKDLAPETRSMYAKKWTEVQERFVDAPGFAVTEADHLVTSVMADRGYPTEGFEQQVADLSVAHGATMDHYRTAHQISSRAARQEASTEELRQAMVHYRALFEELLGAGTGHGTTGREHMNGVADHDRGDGAADRAAARPDVAAERAREHTAATSDARDAGRDGQRG
ncbi:hypothetical protein GCM10009677_60570 [Sphaerisporangium rubeum]|uniref:Secreted protein n=1 Tax=Sphaerisporangium rubeum TaxID=321317 RepID=A0A7X0IFQ3_9ACTN|nr:hypothetical protein [Sphaerisporangium rubeum]MBB6474397.1 hypothetical protein [Sphaerisporangium rubeum]